MRIKASPTWQSPEQGQLQALWKSCGETLDIQLWGIPSLRLQEDLHVAVPCGKVVALAGCKHKMRCCIKKPQMPWQADLQ